MQSEVLKAVGKRHLKKRARNRAESDVIHCFFGGGPGSYKKLWGRLKVPIHAIEIISAIFVRSSLLLGGRTCNANKSQVTMHCCLAFQYQRPFENMSICWLSAVPKFLLNQASALSQTSHCHLKLRSEVSIGPTPVPSKISLHFLCVIFCRASNLMP